MAAPRTFQVMSKPSGSVCNLDCDYCYFLSKEELYPGSGFRMPEAVHTAYVEQLLAAHRDGDEVTFTFQGGEPLLMGLDFFRRTLKLQERFARPGQRILPDITDWATLTRRYPAVRQSLGLWFQHRNSPKPVRIAGWKDEKYAEQQIRAQMQ